MFLRSRGLLKRESGRLCHVLALRLATRRRLSLVNAFQQSKETLTTLDPPYFVPNTQWQTLRLETKTSSIVPQNVTGAPVRPGISTYSLHLFRSHCDLSLYRPISPLNIPRLFGVYGQLSKARLTFLNVLTAMSAVALSPLSTTVPVLLSTALGTALCSASANTLNQLSEVPFDAQMARTRMRPLVRGAISPAHATGFALVTGVMGPTVLLTFANPVAALLGAANIGLYACVYTTLKRHSVVNTWIGSVVGAIPPLIGWTATGGRLFPSTAYPVQLFLPTFLSDLTQAVPTECVDNPLSVLALFCLLFSWQFPHFNSLSYVVRESYAQSGYKMLSVINPPLNALVSLRHAAALVGICSILTPLSGLTTWTFAMTSVAPNIFMLNAAWRFRRKGSEKEARTLFHISLWYLPMVLGLMMLHKQGMEWQNIKWS